MKILYIHGLGGGIDSHTAKILSENLPCEDFYHPEVPINPNKALEFVRNFCTDYKIDLVIGHSLGGFYAMNILGVKKLLINPAMTASKDLISIGLGEQKFLSKRTNGEKTYLLDENFLNELQIQEVIFTKNLTEKERDNTFAIFTRQDELFSHIENFKNVYNKEPIVIEGAHKLTNEQIINTLLPEFNKIKETYFEV